MAGYRNDYSMSNNASLAYDLGEMPLSKWTKSAILSNCGDKAEMLSKLTLSELKTRLLYKSSWHHTSCKYNTTDFYSFDEDELDEITTEDVELIIKSRKPREKKEKFSDEIVKAEITYTIWVGKYRNYRRPKDITETVEMKKSDKMVQTSNGNKRVSSLKSIKFI